MDEQDHEEIECEVPLDMDEQDREEIDGEVPLHMDTRVLELLREPDIEQKEGVNKKYTRMYLNIRFIYENNFFYLVYSVCYNVY
ncbi:hypothetical protein Hanom_Chr16g01467741 [Helianthus anomalus]